MQTNPREPSSQSAKTEKQALVFRLKSLRQILGLSQADLAKRAGISLWLERYLENLRVLPKFIEALARLARVLRMSIWGVFSTNVRERMRNTASTVEAHEADILDPACALVACYRSPYLMIAPMDCESVKVVFSKRLRDRSEIPAALERAVADHGCPTVVVEPDVKELCGAHKFPYDLEGLSLRRAKHVLFPEAARITNDDLVRSIAPTCPFLKERTSHLGPLTKPSITQRWLMLQTLPVAIGRAHYKLKADPSGFTAPEAKAPSD